MAEIGRDINKAIELLVAGELVAIPTETVYGLAGNALSAAAVAKIFSVKSRPHFDPLIVHVPSLGEASRFVHSVPPQALALSKLFWPGPLTMVFSKMDIIPDLVTAGLETVGIRCPDHPLTRELLQKINFPLAAPSANPFGYVSPTRPEHVNDQLGDKINYILDGGPCRVGIESTIVGFEGNAVVVLRLGGLSLEKIEKAIGKVVVRDHASSAPIAPGQLSSHYAPTKQLVLGNILQLVKSFGTENVGTLSYTTVFHDVDKQNQVILSPDGNLEEAAQNLFSGLRKLDKMKVKIILAEEVPDYGLGKAINDRLRRAAASEYKKEDHGT